jgi:hypothetical protein
VPREDASRGPAAVDESAVVWAWPGLALVLQMHERGRTLSPAVGSRRGAALLPKALSPANCESVFPDSQRWSGCSCRRSDRTASRLQGRISWCSRSSSPPVTTASPASATGGARLDDFRNAAVREPGAAAAVPGERPKQRRDGSSSVISLPSNSSWQLSTSIPGYWCRQETVQLGAPESGTLQQILAWPLGTISGSAPPMASSLRGIDVETMAPRSAAARAAGLKGALRCPVDSSGKWSRTLPASVFDLKLSVHGFAPEYRLDVNVPPGTSLDLGPLALRPGASVAGWVQVAGGESLAPQCLVKLTPTDEATTNLPLTGTVRTQGFFQLTGVAPGRYVLEVDQPGFRSPKVPLDVSPGSATYLRGALLLSREPG